MRFAFAVSSIALALAAASKTACPKNDGEIRLGLAIRGLFSDGMVAAGDLVDAGANHGDELCQYADLAPDRTVHGIEPLTANLEHIRHNWLPGRHNIQLHQGVLGTAAGEMQVAMPRGKAAGSQMVLTRDTRAKNSRGTTESIPVFSVDGLLAGNKLAFMHLDVEGFELQALRGAHRVLRRDRPPFTIELSIHGNASFTRELLSFVSALGYQCGAVDEMCGETADGRNLVCLPDSVRRRPFFVRYRLQPVTVSSVFRLASYCRDGGACCPYGRNATEVFDPVRSRWTNCCSNRGCFSLLLSEECAATGALTTSNTDSHCGARRDRHGPVRHRQSPGVEENIW